MVMFDSKFVRLVMKLIRIFKSDKDTCPFMSTSKMDDPEGGMHLSDDKFPEQIIFSPHPFQTVLFRRVPHKGQTLGVKYLTKARASDPDISQSALMLPVTLSVLHELVGAVLRIQRGICLKNAVFDVTLLAGQTIRAGVDEVNFVLLSSDETKELFFKVLMRVESQETNSTTSDKKKYSSGRRVSFLIVIVCCPKSVELLSSEYIELFRKEKLD